MKLIARKKLSSVTIISMLASALYTIPAQAAEQASALAPVPAAALKSDMQLAYERGVVEGYPNDKDLRGAQPVTRAELAIMINRAAKLPKSDNKVKPFPDLEE
jgi:2',3'-cyclic-nucleotide 2'-phosphodiesterase / 3'-nucleotidase / 5'-nucleotidase